MIRHTVVPVDLLVVCCGAVGWWFTIIYLLNIQVMGGGHTRTSLEIKHLKIHTSARQGRYDDELLIHLKVGTRLNRHCECEIDRSHQECDE